MPLSVTKGEGFTVFTVTSEATSRCPLLCQVFSTLCCCPAFYVSGKLRKLMAGPQAALATVQIMVGLLTFGLGEVLLSLYFGPYALREVSPHYWTGTIFIVSGILCLLAERFSSPCLVSMAVAVNLASAILVLAAIVFYGIDDGPRLADVCVSYHPADRHEPDDDYDSQYVTTASINATTELSKRSKHNFRLCQMYKRATMPVMIGLKVLLVVFAALQLCINISVAVLYIKALKKNNEVEDHEVQQPLMAEVTANPVA